MNKSVQKIPKVKYIKSVTSKRIYKRGEKMPTGYTAYIKDGDITTGKDFLKLCLRNFGIAINMRDEPLSKPVPTQFEPNPYYKKDYEKTVEVRNKYRQMTFDEAKKELIDKHKKDMKSAKKSLDEFIAEDERYMKIRDEIEKWIPPTSEHENVKKFALNQIDISLNTDIREYYNKELSKDLDVSDEAVYSYMNDINEFYEDDVARAYKRWQEELKRTADKNMWMKQFLDSLENM